MARAPSPAGTPEAFAMTGVNQRGKIFPACRNRLVGAYMPVG